jgi:hypothetical protein
MSLKYMLNGRMVSPLRVRVSHLLTAVYYYSEIQQTVK